MRRTNNHFRETSEMKRRAVRDEWINMNRTSAFHIKSDRSDSEKKLNEEKQLVNSLLKVNSELFRKETKSFPKLSFSEQPIPEQNPSTTKNSNPAWSKMI
jgi:hypothetical protein